jgi:palmitoyltransferase
MAGYHLWSAARGETSVEAQDNEVYRKISKGRGEVGASLDGLQEPSLIGMKDFTNSYDLGVKRNLQLFFNIGPQG